eukprot:gene50935-62295_t
MNRRTFLTHLGAAAASVPLLASARAAEKSPAPTAPKFISRLQPAVVGGGFELPDHWVWCGAPIRGEDGNYHLFASRIPKTVLFHPHWLFMSEIVRAEPPTPVGPYKFAEVALAPRGGDFFDGRTTHNPHIRKVGDTYLLLEANAQGQYETIYWQNQKTGGELLGVGGQVMQGNGKGVQINTSPYLAVASATPGNG